MLPSPCSSSPLWWLTTDQDTAFLELSARHYPTRKYADGRRRFQAMGPGEKVALRTKDGDAVWGWRKFIDDCIDQRTGERQRGVNCSIFRNEGPVRSSELVQQACAIAARLWPDSRLYTYVDPSRVVSRNPGFCFIAAGWKRCGRTKSGLIVLERIGSL